MLAFYGDGTGEHGKGPFAVAGYIANTIDWFELERDWTTELLSSPSIKYFKARECILRHSRSAPPDYDGQFKGWTEDAVRRKRKALADIINKHCQYLVAISAVLPWDVYHSQIGEDVMKKVFYTPYLICMNGVIINALKRSNEQFRNHGGRLAFVFDTERIQVDVDAAQHYRLTPPVVPTDLAERCGSITFCSDIKFPMLQVADFLAWSIRAEQAGFDSPCLETIFTNDKIGGQHEFVWTREKLARLVATTEEDFRKRFPEGIVG
jgi:hypothetical protein